MKVYICENCSKEHNGSYGSGRFCSKHCKSVWVGKKSNVTMKKNGNKKCNFNVNKNNHGRKPYGNWKCICCNLIFETRAQLYKHKHELHPIIKGSSWNKGLTKETDPRIAKIVKTCYERNHYKNLNKGKILSKEHKDKISKSMKKYFLKHPDKVPYILNHSSHESYPEKYFREAFLNEQFPNFKQDRYVNGYFLDFAFEEYKCYIEIDGEQHYVDKNIVEHDKIRNDVLNKTEWKCISRVRWSEFQKLSSEQKHNFLIDLKQKILFS